jgi:centromeric protein E
LHSPRGTSCDAGRHIPYRDSKLTRILQPSLGGSGRTAIICTISEEQVHAEESHNTLEFATRAKRVVNSVSATETITSAALLKRQAKEIDKLKEQLREKG